MLKRKGRNSDAGMGGPDDSDDPAVPYLGEERSRGRRRLDAADALASVGALRSRNGVVVAVEFDGRASDALVADAAGSPLQRLVQVQRRVEGTPTRVLLGCEGPRLVLYVADFRPDGSVWREVGAALAEFGLVSRTACRAGVAVDQPDLLPGAIIDRARLALRQTGPERPLVWYDPSTTVAAFRAEAVRASLLHPASLIHDVRFQQVVDARARDTVAFEVLSRFDIVGIGRVTPVEVFRVAARCGLERELTANVLRAALRACTGAGLPAVAVNVSDTLLSDPAFISQLVREVDCSGMDPSRLTVELVEGTPAVDVVAVGAGFRRLRREGIATSIDDFGTGAWDVHHLCHLDATEVKLDRSLVAALVTSARVEAVIRNVIAVAHDLGIRVLAEGVEDAPTATRAVELGCARLQGFLISAPMRLPEAVALCHGNARERAAGLESRGESTEPADAPRLNAV